MSKDNIIYEGKISHNGESKKVIITCDISENNDQVYKALLGEEEVLLKFNQNSDEWEEGGKVTPFSREAGKLIEAFFD